MHPVLNRHHMLALKAFNNPNEADPKFTESDISESVVLTQEEADFKSKMADVNSWGVYWKNVKISLAAGAGAGGVAYLVTRNDNNGQGLFAPIFAAAVVASSVFQLTTHVTLENSLDDKLKIVNELADERMSRLRTKISNLRSNQEDFPESQKDLVVEYFSRGLIELKRCKQNEKRKNEQAHARLNQAREENHNRTMSALNQTSASFREQHAISGRDHERQAQQNREYERSRALERARQATRRW